MKKILFMVSSMNIGGVEKSLLSLLSIIPREEYEVTVLLLNKSGGFLNHIPSWVKVEEATWFKDIKPIIMEAPQVTLKNYIKKKKYIDGILLTFSYFIDKHFKNILRSIPMKEDDDVAIAYAGPIEIIDSYITHKVNNKYIFLGSKINPYIFMKECDIYTTI